MEINRRQWSSMLIMSVLAISLIFGATGCVNDNNGENNDVIIENNNDAPANSNTNIDIDADSNEPDATEKPAE